MMSPKFGGGKSESSMGSAIYTKEPNQLGTLLGKEAEKRTLRQNTNSATLLREKDRHAAIKRSETDVKSSVPSNQDRLNSLQQ